jgi:hypothetical protein
MFDLLPSGGAGCVAPLRACQARPRSGRLAAVGAFALLLCNTAPALADDDQATVIELNSPVIYVASHLDKYTEMVSGTPIVGKIRATADADVSGKVKSIRAWPLLGVSAGQSDFSSHPWRHLSNHGFSKDYGLPRPKQVSEDFLFTLTPADYKGTPELACNAYADHLRAQGHSNSEIFSQDRWIEIAVAAAVSAEFTGISGSPVPSEVESWANYKKVNVICQRDPSMDAPAAPDVFGASLSVEVVRANAAQDKCELRLNGSVTTKEAGTEVKFVYVDDTGKTSDVKTVQTRASKVRNFEHSFPLPKGKKSGRIQIVGQSHAFLSNWADYTSICDGIADDVKTVLPPKAFHLEAIPMADTVMYRGLVCPAKVKIWGIIQGRGDWQGNGVLAVGNTPKAMEPYDISDGQQVIVQAEHGLSWEGLQSPQQNVKFSLYVTDKDGKELDQMQVTQNFVCREPQVSGAVQGAPQGLASKISSPKATNLLVSELGKKTQNGYVCPVKGRVSAFVQSDAEGFSGTLAIFAGGSLKKEIALDLPANHGISYPYDYELPWNGSTIPSQHVVFAMKVLNKHGHEVASKEKIEQFNCTEIVTTGVAMPGGAFATEQPEPLGAQQGRPAAAGQLAVGPALAILSPKGTVRRGDIRLTGGPANATYELTFYRKVNSSYQQVNIAGLPKQMTGPTASFNLAALDGGRQWRLEVCPVMGGQGSCKTSDFRVPVIGQKKQQAPAQGTPFVIVPGAIPQ